MFGYISPEIANYLNTNPRDAVIGMFSYLISDAIFINYESQIIAIFPTLVATFVYLAFRKININFTTNDACRMTDEIFSYRAACYKKFEVDRVKLSAQEIEENIDRIVNRYFQFEKPYYFSPINGYWSQVGGPILWICLHIIFSYENETDKSIEIVKMKMALLRILDIFITCGDCKQHYKRHLDAIMVVLEPFVNDDEKLMIKIHSYVTSQIHKQPINWSTFSPQEEFYLQTFRQLSHQIKNRD
ncbi:MAG: hypothetical protein ACRYGG_06135 [Janthinobacterium lividum]